MNVRGLVVCVDYPDLLERGLSRWHIGLDRLVVVTSPKDERTQGLCRKYNVETHVTDIFYANGAKFNKGAAMSEAVLATQWRRGAEWLLTFDADIVPPANWRDRLEAERLVPGCLYGTYRWMVPEDVKEPIPELGRKMPQGWVIGFFTLFHNQDSVLPTEDEPLFDVCWPHAGNYDTLFCRLWPRDRQVILPSLKMVHLGEERRNWVGRGEYQTLKADVLDQRRGWEDWNRERMTHPPVIRVGGREYRQRSRP